MTDTAAAVAIEPETLAEIRAFLDTGVLSQALEQRLSSDEALQVYVLALKQAQGLAGIGRALHERAAAAAT